MSKPSTRTFDHHLSIRGLHIMVNGVDGRKFDVFGLHGQLAFFYARDVRIEHFRCLDLGPKQYGIHVCTFEDLFVDDVIIKGDKHGASSPFLRIGTPADVVTITNSTFREGGIVFQGNNAMTDYGRTVVNVHGCIFRNSTVMEQVVSNCVDGKEVVLNTSANVAI